MMNDLNPAPPANFFYDVLLPVVPKGVYTYSSAFAIERGARLFVKLGRSELAGICLGETSKPSFECREISAVADDKPYFDDIWLKFIEKIADYYAASLGATLHGVIAKRLLTSDSNVKEFTSEPVLKREVVLTPEQLNAYRAVDLGKSETHLLYGVTGSGKTEVFLELIKDTLAGGRQALYIVPEISLTPQLIERIGERLGFKPLVFHYKLSQKLRERSFWQFAKGAPFVIGARSALFLPPKDLGLIIVDEEHETTYKQEESPCYELRDMAVLYGRMRGIPVILASATPQVETYRNAKLGKFTLSILKERAMGSALPQLSIIDQKKHRLDGGIIASPIFEKLVKTVEGGEQAIIFLNRKGYATTLVCKGCGDVFYCPNCSVPMTLYGGGGGSCVCNYCGEGGEGYRCPGCGSSEAVAYGVGTERVEEFLREAFPGLCMRIDANSVSSLSKLHSLLEDFNNRKAQVLIGTQLIAKGLHFPHITFVGILGIDNILGLPDFRAAERAYQLVTQVSGRAGRESRAGAFHIQTASPTHPLYSHIGDPDAFYEQELERRKRYLYPPFVKLARLCVSFGNEREAAASAAALTTALKGRYSEAVYLGPARAPMYKIKNLYRYSILIKCNTHKYMRELLGAAGRLFEEVRTGSMTLKLDRDPYYFM